jgi:hypothetical protein
MPLRVIGFDGTASDVEGAINYAEIAFYLAG